MIFVKANNYASSYLRADQIANNLGVSVYMNTLPDNLEGETVVFVKTVDPDLVIKASISGAKIIYDPIDNFAYAERLKWQHWFYFVDTVIAYNAEMSKFLKSAWFKKSTIVPHQWDERLKDSPQATMTAFNAAYIGHDFNCPSIVPGSGVAMITDPQAMVGWANNFNCHVSVRNAASLEAKMKPATKVSLASAVGAVIITSPDASVVELLPSDYPYWCSSIDQFPKVLDKARDEFGTAVWDRALDMLEDVRNKTSLEAIAERYKLL